jgi:hypothetical protein
MKILVFHQPFPMGNYLLNQRIAEHFQRQGHEVYMLQQLNGLSCSEEYIQQILDLDLDLCYYEMLDHETFKIIERLKCTRILLYASRGILPTYDDILSRSGQWYDKIFTNSLQMYNMFVNKGIEAEHFEFYHSVINDTDGYNVKYDFPCVFLGMGFNRLTDPHYELERELYFQNNIIMLFGNGWEGHPNWKGVLPADKIESLYKSAQSAIGIIEKGQREQGMINNRYTEIAYCKCPLISYKYDTIDWYGAEQYINFITSPNEVTDLIVDMHKSDKYKAKAEELYKFMKMKDKEFYQKLESLL